MSSDQTTTAFTPLRIALMIFIGIAISGAIIAYIFNTQPWAHNLSIFSTVFILMSVFIMLLEIIWVNAMRKNITDLAIKTTYKKALNIYLFLLSADIIVSVLALQVLIQR